MFSRNGRASQKGTMWEESTRGREGLSDESPRSKEQDRYGEGGGDDRTSAAAAARRSADKIRCLDGLRGVACLLVFNYHFLWPWTPAIMLGYGAMPPGSPEPYFERSSLPILCLLQRGRPMVAIFFAISGYVLCRHILRAIHERRLEAAYQGLASSVFRRVFRLYIPPTISMFLVAVLAQMGAFRSEDDIYKGPDSRYINGTVTVAHLNSTCANGTHAVEGAPGIARYLGLTTPVFLGNVTNNETSTLCVNATSQLFMPPMLYRLADDIAAKAKAANEAKGLNGTVINITMTDAPTTSYHDLLHLSAKPVTLDASKTPPNVTGPPQFSWVQLGGSWEEHPFIHDNITYALSNFTRAYVEWANPFNFGHYHTRYDPHTFTIPMELRGSMFIYLFLMGTAALKAKWRFRLGSLLSAYSLVLGRRNGRQAGPGQPAPSSSGARWAVLFVALYLLSYPDAGAEWTPGFAFLSSLVPRYYIPLSGWMFYQAMGALLLLPCVLHSPLLRRLLEARVAQYLGKISFSFYLVHGPVLHSLGFWIMPRLFERLGRNAGLVVGWVILLGVSLYLSDWWCRKIDVWSATVGRKVEKMMKD
ncbi:acyltransferase 3 [Colletotrichum navitas]|uniref:Acyltransferase 3 n=1 Tax=Colletotrichum navitas TaxID=681940 RepID=A0AAD8UYM8_9PEZI|nr:acyltransferase 3 [Colletotrichum navitas]KAK1573986.1 acyltransferase 3 [Colletotrichum navitas]